MERLEALFPRLRGTAYRITSPLNTAYARSNLAIQMVTRIIVDLPIRVHSENAALHAASRNGYPLDRSEGRPLFGDGLYMAEPDREFEYLFSARAGTFIGVGFLPVLLAVADETLGTAADTHPLGTVISSEEPKGGIPTRTDRVNEPISRIALGGKDPEEVVQVGCHCTFPPLPRFPDCHERLLKACRRSQARPHI